MATSKKAVPEFSQSPASPFADGYDLQAEQTMVQHLIDADDPDPADPLYARFVMFEERTRELKQMQAEYKMRQQSNREVSMAEAAGITEIGALVEDGDDEMLIHTRDAMRLFLGRAAEPGGGGTGRAMAGGKKVAATLRQLWYLSANNNPYADWALIEMAERVEVVRKALELEQAGVVKRMDELKQRGLSYSIVKSSAPVVTRLGFRSPYGYGVASLVVDFDYCARVLKSAQRRDLLTSSACHDKLERLKHSIRSIFERVVYFQRYLSREELMPLSRNDFLPSADEEAKRRVKAVVGIFSECPRDVFNGDKQPRHSLRRVELSSDEYKLLSTVPLSVEEPAAAGLI